MVQQAEVLSSRTWFFFHWARLLRWLELSYSKSRGSRASWQHAVCLVSFIMLNFNFINSQTCKTDKGINDDEEIYPA